MQDILAVPFVVARRLAWPVGPGAFRLFLAMLVFVHHFSSLGLGGYAVYVFFVLSGFWLQTMWRDRYVRTYQPYLTYLVSRVWRLAPVMALVSLITIPLLLVIGIPAERIFGQNLGQLAFSSVFLLGYSWLEFGPVGSAWSLDVEMQFYLVAPLMALAVAMPRGRWVMLVGCGALSLAVSDPHLVPILPKYLAFFAIGMVAAGSAWRPSGRLAAASALVVVLGVVGVFLSPWRGILIGGGHPGPLYQYNFAYNVALALLSVPFAIHTTGRPSDATDRMMADLSYIIYLQHWVAMQWFFTITGPFSKRLAVAAISFALVPVGSWLIWYCYDKPINRARARWVASRAQRVVPAGVLAEPAAP